MNNGITLLPGDFGSDYVLEHDDGRTILIQSDLDYYAVAMTMGFNPCAKCRRACRGGTDGSIDCQRRTASGHLAKAQEWLDSHLLQRVKDPGHFEPITYPCDPDLIRALFQLAYEHHSGQSSRGYRLLCQVQRYARKHGVDLDIETRASRQLYHRLVAHYGTRL